MKRLLPALFILILLLMPLAHASSIKDVAWIKQKGYVKYSYTLSSQYGNFSGIYIFEYKSYKSVDGKYNITIDEKFYLEGYGRDNETETYTRDYNNKARVAVNDLPFFDQQRYDKAVDELKQANPSISFSEEETTYKVGDKTFEAIKLYGENSTDKITIILGKYIGVILYVYDEDKSNGSISEAKATDTNLKEEKGIAGGSSTLRIIVAIVAIIIIALAIYFLMMKKQ